MLLLFGQSLKIIVGHEEVFTDYHTLNALEVKHSHIRICWTAQNERRTMDPTYLCSVEYHSNILMIRILFSMVTILFRCLQSQIEELFREDSRRLKNAENGV